MSTSEPVRPHPWLHVVTVWALGLVAAGILLALQYARPMPLGGAYLLRPTDYATFALSFEAFGLFLLSLPSLALSLLPVPSIVRTLGIALQITLLTLSLLLSQLNHELQRFMGAQLDWDTLVTYYNVFRTPEVIWHALRDDQGGAYSALWLYLVAIAFAGAAYAAVRRLPTTLPVRFEAMIAGAFVIIGCVQPWLGLARSNGVNRKLKLRPPLVLLWDSARDGIRDERRFANVQATIARWQQDWLAQDGSGQYRFDDPRYPLRHHRVAPFPAGSTTPKPNVILLSLETFRARDMRLFNPELKVEPTPFLDGLARDPDSAYYPRYITNGLPTIFAFMSMQTGTLPHSKRVVASSFTGDSLDAFPTVLRERGYKAMFFTASDPDWDNERVWLSRWYDETHYKAYATRDRDRKTFIDAAKRIIEVGRSGQPFVATIASINNHAPFRTPDHAFDIERGRSAQKRIHNTMHYTDDIVRQLFERLRDEPWFEHTVFIVTGDHGYDLGERGQVIGHDNLRHESTWVPLIIHGRNVPLPRGEQTRVASHIDLAPTIAELAGSTGPYAFQGHSLLEPATDRQLAIAVRNGNIGLEAKDFSAYVPLNGPSVVYRGDDCLQQSEQNRRDWPALWPALAHARDASLVTDWAFEHDRFAPSANDSSTRPVAAVAAPSNPAPSSAAPAL